MNLLHLEDSENDALLVEILVHTEWPECRIHRVVSRADYEAALASADFDLILSDHDLPGFDGLIALELARRLRPEKPFVFLSGTIGEERAIDALKRGAEDYVIKDRPARLVPAIRRALARVEEAALRRRAEEALRQNQERFRQIAENVADMIAVLDVEGRRVYNNPAYRAVLGDPDALRGTDSFKDIHPDDRERVRAAFAATVGTAAGRRIEYRFLPPDGIVRYIESQSSVIRDAGGRVTNVLVVSRDVTERRQAGEIQAKLAAIVESSADAIMSETLEGVIASWNPAAEKLFGYSAVEAIGRPATLLIPPERAGEERLHLVRIERGDRVEPFETVRVRQDGTRIQVSSTLSPIKDGVGKIIGVAKISRDITERKLAEQQIREQAALLDKAQDAIYVRDLDGRITYWNRAAEHIYGWKAAEVIGRRADEFLHRNTVGALEKRGDKDDWTGELRHLTKAGREIVVEARRTLLRDDHGVPTVLLNINTDVTEKKKLEGEFLRTQRMESIGTLAGGIAHDLNNVLAPILMGAELLRRDVVGASASATLRAIEASAQHGAALVRQLLGFARGTEGERAAVQAGPLLEDLATLLRQTLKRIAIEVRLGPALAPVFADATQLKQVILNLCINARDAMPGGGVITLTAANVAVDEALARTTPHGQAGPHLRLGVADTGSGIPAEILEKIFDPFFTTKGIGKGTGLGLSTVRGIVKGHNGFLQVESIVGVGTTFYLFLPALEGPLAPPPEVVLPGGRNEMILVIDDDPGVRGMLRPFLAHHGYRVMIAADGRSGLDCFRQGSGEIAAVITDMMMGGVSGASVIATLRQQDPGLPIIAISGQMGTAELTPGFSDQPISAKLSKPFEPPQLLTALRRVLDAAAPREGR